MVGRLEKCGRTSEILAGHLFKMRRHISGDYIFYFNRESIRLSGVLSFLALPASPPWSLDSTIAMISNSCTIGPAVLPLSFHSLISPVKMLPA
jgi:hypothetical protein